MAVNVPDEAFDAALARHICQLGMVTAAQVEEAQQAQAEAAERGSLIPLAQALVQLDYITKVQRENIEREVQAQLEGAHMMGQYKLLSKLGEGGMGTVYLAEDTIGQRQVALKVLARKHVGDAQFLSRFHREARAVGRLNHPGIVAAYTVGEEAGQHFLVMEYCEGESLEKTLKRDGFVPCEAAFDIAAQVAHGLQHAHEHGVIHRDIKPANIVVSSNGAAKILDMGLSKSLGGGDQSFSTQTGVALGTPHYVSPEQARGDKEIDGRADIYSLGATLYHVVTGQTPFHGSTAAIVMMKHLSEQLPNPQDIRDDIPDSVVQVIQKMMAKEVADRYRDCNELLVDLELVLDGKMPSSQAIDVGRSSVALPIRAVAARPLTVRPRQARVARPPSGTSPTKKQEPVAEALTPEEAAAKARAQKFMYAALAGALLLLILPVWLLTSSREPEIAKQNVLKPGQQKDTATATPGKPSPATPAGPGTGQTRLLQPSASKEIEDLRNERAARMLEEHKAWFKAHPQDPWGYKEKLSALTAGYGSAPAGAAATKILAELRAPEGDRPPDSITWHRDWQITPKAYNQMQELFDYHPCVLQTHPVEPGKPCILSRKWKVPEDKPVLEFNIRAHETGDCKLIAAVAGRKLLEQDIGLRTWRTFSLDLSALKGQEVEIALEHHNTGWINEHAWWQAPHFVEKPAETSKVVVFAENLPAAVPAPPVDAAGEDPARWANAINLLALIDPQKDAVAGSWQVLDGALTSDNAAPARIAVPYRPGEEYDYRIVFTRRAGKDCVSQIVTSRGRSFRWLMGGWYNAYFGFDLIAGKAANGNESSVKSTSCLEDGRRYISVVQVRKEGVAAFLDGKLVTRWKTDYSDMSSPSDTRLPDEKLLGLCIWNSPTTFHRIEVLEVTGRGTFTRPDDPAVVEAEKKRGLTGPPIATPVQPLPAAERPWQALFDGRTLGCIRGQGEGAWRVDNSAIVHVPGANSAAQTVQTFGDAEVRIRFEAGGGDGLFFRVRQGPDGSYNATWSGTQALAALAGKTHELVFTCRGDTVTATLDGQPKALEASGQPRKGPLQFNVRGSALRVLSIEHRELPPETAAVAAAPPKPASATATFVMVDIATQGNWKGRYGSDGYGICNDAAKYPVYAQVMFTGNKIYLWTDSTTDVRGLQKATGADRIAATWHCENGLGTRYTIKLDLADGRAHQVAVYCLDWDRSGGDRQMKVEVREQANGASLDTQSLPSFYGGAYLVWIMKGRLTLEVVTTGGVNACVSGLFFDSTPCREVRQEGERAICDADELLSRNDVNAALARLEQARADPKFVLMRAALDTATDFARSMESVNQAALAGAALLVDKRKFTFRTGEGQVVRTGEGSRNTVTGVKDGTILVDQEAGGAKVAQIWKLADLSPQTRYELACLSMPPGPESDLTLAFAGIVALLDGAEGVTPKQLLARIEAAEKAKLPQEKIDFLLRRLEVCEREAEAAQAVKRADVLLKDKNKGKVREYVLWLKKNFAGTAALARWLEARGGDLEKILGRPGLRATYYERTGNMTAASLNDTTLGALGTRTVPNLNLPLIGDLSEVFGRSENVAVRFCGHVNVPKDGQYTFYITSDDGSILEVAGKLRVDNDGTHVMGEKSGVMTLTAGQHPFRVSYHQGTGGAGLIVSWSGPDIPKEIIPPSAFSHDAPDIETIPQPEIPAGAPLPKTLVLDLGGGAKVDLVLVPAGEFDMGSGDGEMDERPAHKVRITRPFYLGKCEVTVGQFKRFADKAGYKTEAEKLGKATTLKDRKWQELPGVCWKAAGLPQDGSYPAVLLTWYDAQAFVGWACECTGRKVRLPTEAEWEYAARGPQGLKYPWGNDWDGRRANHADATFKNSRVGDPKWGYSTDTDGFALTAPAGRIPNASWCGAHDMAGNAWEWVLDRYSDKYYAESPPSDPQGPTGGNDRVFRGGSWQDGADACRGAKRRHAVPGVQHTPCLGFRVVVAAPAGAEAAAEAPKLEPGLWTSYWSGDSKDKFKTMRLARPETKVSWAWGEASPDLRVPVDNFGVRFAGKLRVDRDGRYGFKADADDGVEGWVNGQKVIEKGKEAAAPLQRGDHDLRVVFTEGGGGAFVKVQWKPEGAADWQEIPEAALWHDPSQKETYQR